jgi:membrane protease YdiL (CAAX protease family)
MDGNAPRRGGSTVRTLAIALAVVVLVAVVAVASTGSVPTGGNSVRRPSEGFVDTAISLFLVMMVLCAVFVAVALTWFRRYDPTAPARSRRGPLRSIVSLILSIAVLALFVRAIAGSRGEQGGLRLPDFGQSGRGSSDDAARYDPEFAVWPVVAVVALLAVAGMALWLSARGRRAAMAPAATPAEALADVLAETLDDLRTERDPRRAVIAAYARMERGLAASGLPRSEAEAPEEYLARVLDDIEISPRAAGRLTALFAWARFSVHDVRPEMKDEAIETLEQVQRELAAAETARDAQLAGAPA